MTFDYNYTYEELLTEFSIKELEEIRIELERRMRQMVVQEDMIEIARVLKDIEFIQKDAEIK